MQSTLIWMSKCHPRRASWNSNTRRKIWDLAWRQRLMLDCGVCLAALPIINHQSWCTCETKTSVCWRLLAKLLSFRAASKRFLERGEEWLLSEKSKKMKLWPFTLEDWSHRLRSSNSTKIVNTSSTFRRDPLLSLHGQSCRWELPTWECSSTTEHPMWRLLVFGHQRDRFSFSSPSAKSAWERRFFTIMEQNTTDMKISFDFQWFCFRLQCITCSLKILHNAASRSFTSFIGIHVSYFYLIKMQKLFIALLLWFWFLI